MSFNKTFNASGDFVDPSERMRIEHDLENMSPVQFIGGGKWGRSTHHAYYYPSPEERIEGLLVKSDRTFWYRITNPASVICEIFEPERPEPPEQEIEILTKVGDWDEDDGNPIDP